MDNTSRVNEPVFCGTAYVKGCAAGILLASDLELSLWGGVEPQTSEVIDRHHPLSGKILSDTILAIPGGRGSCTGSVVILELLLNGKAPKAILFERREDILTLGVIVAEEIFGKTIPVVMLEPADFASILKLNGEFLHVADGHVSTQGFPNSTPPISIGQTTAEMDLNYIKLSDLDRTILNGDLGDAARVAMRIVLRFADLLGAMELMDVTQVHVDGCGYNGPGCLAFAENLRGRGGRVRIPTSLNSISVDKLLRQVQGPSDEFTLAAERLADTYMEIGARPTFTCAPYQLDSAPKFGEQVAWAESNAVVYANSVLGARTMKYPDFLDICIALTGRAPRGGPHVDINRKATVVVGVLNVRRVSNIDDSFYPLLGYHVGALAPSEIPVIIGIESLRPTNDDMKAFGAAFATVSSAPMFHVVGITPEATTLEAALTEDSDWRRVDVHLRDLLRPWEELNSASAGQSVDLISLGNPHFSFDEIRALNDLCRGRKKHKDVAMMVTCGRTVYAAAYNAGMVNELEQFGVRFITDTCWCMLGDPTIPRSQSATMTNSGKYAHYGPGLTGKSFYFGSIDRCVAAACEGISTKDRPRWLEEAMTKSGE
ncbi:hypothetical protein BDV26DRAFT_288607 [Aspergillus bertholletiae]|uniref:DUF521 domain protein n=1 Tax=Aspergillus bertholletiae TaxID=1226010 RepID=A0A5N7BKK3_9EURO|nr:hypothetical protein BDV26DRAFT_288607 [Aspergillus bertholletiae]